MVLAIYVALIARGLHIALEAQTASRGLWGELALTLFIYVFVNMGMSSGSSPWVGIPLPHQLRRDLARDSPGHFGILMSFQTPGVCCRIAVWSC